MEGRNVGLRRGAAAWSCTGAQRVAAHWWEAAQGGIMGPRMGAARSCAGVQQRVAAQSWGGCVGVQRHGGALARSVCLYRGAVRRCAGA